MSSRYRYISSSTFSFASAVSDKVKSSFSVHLHLKAYKRLFYLAAEPVWYIAILIANYLSIVAVIFASFNSKCLHNPNYSKYQLNEICYVLDIIYIPDILVAIGCKLLPSWDLIEVDVVLRPYYIIVLEVFSLIPFEFCVSRRTLIGERIFCVVKLTKVLRFARIIYFYMRYKNLIRSKIYIRVIALIAMDILVMMLIYSIYCNTSCRSGICKDSNCDKPGIIALISSIVISSGLAQFSLNFAWCLISTLGTIVSYYLINLLTTCEIGFEIFQNHIQAKCFVISYNNVFYKQKMWKSPKILKEATHSYFSKVWKTRHGYCKNTFFEENLPYSFKNEMMIDIAWVAFQHAHLFKKQSLPFLREIAKYIKQEYKLPGEFIWKRGEWKDKMIYIVSGTLQLLSEEDGESPILSLTSGTCIGDSCVINIYPSRNNVRCKGFCELYTLKACDFIRLYVKFPEEFSMAKLDIKWRYNQAKGLNSIVLEGKRKMQGRPRNLDIYSLLWTKNTLHKHMSKDAESMRRHRFKNIYLINETNPKDFKRVIFTAYFLDSLAVSERLEIETDTVFLKHSCPCILQPDSVIVHFWEVFIILVTIFVSFLIPQKAFFPNADVSWLSLIMFLCTLIFWFDIYVQFSIGITSRDGTKGTFKSIAKEKMSTFGFWADLISCFPLEVIKCITYKNPKDSKASLLFINRLIKIYRIEKFLKNWEKKFNAKIAVIQFIRYTWILSYAIYFTYCYLHTVIIGDLPKHDMVLITVQIMTLTGITGQNLNNNVFFVLNMLSMVIILIIQANFISASALGFLKETHVQRHVATLYQILKTKPKYLKKMRIYFNTQWQDNRCENILKKSGLIYDLPPHLKNNMIFHASKDRLGNIKAFRFLPEDVVNEMFSSILKYTIFSPYEFIIKTGDVSNLVVLVYGGVTEILDPGVTQELDSRPYAINFVEACLRAPSSASILSTTHVKAFYFDIEDYEKVLNKRYDLWMDYKSTINNCDDLSERCREICGHEKDIGVIYKDSGKNKKSSYKFPHSIIPDSYAEYDFFIPYDKLYPFHGIRYFLMRTTFLPNGKFLFYWECFRCFFSIISSIAFFSNPFITKYYAIAIFLDLTCYADIYVRLHVAYYNKHGVLVVHPVKTSQYYLTHSFIIDLLGVLPLGYFSSIDAFGYYTLNFPRLFQLYRYIGFIRELRKDPTKFTNKVLSFMYLPLGMVIINFLGSLMVNVECEQQGNGQICLEGLMMATPNRKWFDDVFIHVGGLYVAATAFVNFGMGVFDLKYPFSTYWIAMICVVGLYSKFITIARLLPTYSFTQFRLINYQGKLKELKSFLNTLNTHHILRKAILDTYELKWKLTQGRDIHDLTEGIIGTLRTDFIYSCYGERLYQHCVFIHKRRSFYRNLLVLSKYECYIQDGYVLTINDISNRVFVLCSGTVDVIAADGSILARLKPTSFFGNFDCKEFSRMKISVVATKPSEVLYINSKDFYKLLNQYPKIKHEFNELRLKFVSYIPSREKSFTKADLREGMLPITVSRWKKLCGNLIQKILVRKLFLLFYCCYFAIVLDLYQLGSNEYRASILIMQYTADILYFMQFFSMKMIIGIKDFIVASFKGMIKEKWVEMKNTIFQRKNTRVILAMISSIPIDVVILLSMNDSNLKFTLFGIFRLNRLLRLLTLNDYFRKIKTTVDTHVTFVRIFYIIAWLSLVWLALTSILSLLTCAIPFSILPPLPVCIFLSQTSSWYRFEIYLKYFSLIGDFFTFTGQHSFTGQHPVLLLAFAIGKLISLFLVSIVCSQIYSVVKDANARRISYKNFCKRVYTFLRLEDVSIALIDRIMRYMELLWLKSKGCNYPVFLQTAPFYLQDAILYDAYFQLIGQHPLFVHCHKDFIRQVIQKCTTDIYFNADYIQFKGAVSTCMYFIFKGIVKVVEEAPTHDFKVKTLTEGQSFGILEGLYGKKKHDYTFQAEGSVIIVSLEFEKWGYLLDFFPASKVRLYSMAEQYFSDE